MDVDVSYKEEGTAARVERVGHISHTTEDALRLQAPRGFRGGVGHTGGQRSNRKRGRGAVRDDVATDRR